MVINVGLAKNKTVALCSTKTILLFDSFINNRTTFLLK